MFDPERMRMRRLKLRLSQKRLGEMIGQDQAYISRLESGKIKEITVQTLELLSDALAVSADYLLGRGPTNEGELEADDAVLVEC